MAAQPGYPAIAFVPWDERTHSFKATDGRVPTWSCPSPDWLPDDRPIAQQYISDLAGFKQGSPWNTWQRDDEDPTLAVLVMELLGGPCDGTRSAEDKEDVVAVFDDIANCGVLHENLSPWNVLSYDGPASSQQTCQRHGIVHRWRVIDFDRSWFVDLDNTTTFGSRTVHSRKTMLDSSAGFSFRSK
ncbi:hypothetical protein EST38_g4928 [Candolleomyces aberdarensis]|uniref:Protein kinase domain-containing protein n=1 Tax=Candolleomyces aberdarensis TaxID=2316362 RepID=A0A4Q2DLS7_9AGAR|nr:hypothetical protein EST38_g4928 [Candolleomyces aberdarensis]